MSAPHADDPYRRRSDRGGEPPEPTDATVPRNGHQPAAVLVHPSVPLPRDGAAHRATDGSDASRDFAGRGDDGTAAGATVPAPRRPAPRPTSAAPGAEPVPGLHPGPHTPPMPWPAIPPAPVPAVYPGGTAEPGAGPNRRWPSLAGLTGRIGAVAGGLGAGTPVPHRAAFAVGLTLLMAIGVAAATYTGAGGTDDAGVTPRSAPAAPVPADLVAGTTAADPAAFGAVPEFRSPSGNISCRMDEDGTRCDVASRSWTPPADPDCADGSGEGLVVGGAGGARASCGGAPADPTGGSELDYDTHLTRGDVTCASRRSGVECRDAGSGHGFEAARASFRLY
ncbi:hypothetical protein ACLFMI_25920 [Pseudonocardia nantongensis]|uniref:hypothetical protein n=1 Tax=Pseudonocardia nantongensis TaxID=1181885 RepID=UPI00397BBE74